MGDLVTVTRIFTLEDAKLRKPPKAKLYMCSFLLKHRANDDLTRSYTVISKETSLTFGKPSLRIVADCDLTAHGRGVTDLEAHENGSAYTAAMSKLR